MFFITKSVTWLIIGFFIVRPALFEDAVSDHGADIVTGAAQARQIAQSGLATPQNGKLINGEVVKFCLDRKELCKQTVSAIGDLIVGSVTPMQMKAHTKKQELPLMSSNNNKEPFVPMPRMRPDYF